jgi:hypothetical protein
MNQFGRTYLCFVGRRNLKLGTWFNGDRRSGAAGADGPWIVWHLPPTERPLLGAAAKLLSRKTVIMSYGTGCLSDSAMSCRHLLQIKHHPVHARFLDFVRFFGEQTG